MAARPAPGGYAESAVVAFGYDADVVGLIDVASSNTIRDHGKALATQVAQKRLLGGRKDRPLIFVVHGLGGLICEQVSLSPGLLIRGKCHSVPMSGLRYFDLLFGSSSGEAATVVVAKISQALLVSRGAAELWMNVLLESTAGIAFLGTPHSGSNLADWASILTRFSGLIRPTTKAIVSVLQPGSEMLANLQQEFHTMLAARQTQGRPVPSIYCFFDELPYNGAVGLMVPRHLAILNRYGNQGVHANHVGMTRFADRMDQGYQNVCNQLRIWALEIESDARRGHVQQLGSEELDIRRGNRFGDVRRLEGPSHAYSGPVSSYGGQVIKGNLTSFW
ncbi:MAG: hypothetical protein Q9173_006607 [Seirophora scorigena]